MRRSSVRMDSVPGVVLAKFDDGRRLVMTRDGCYEPDAFSCDRLDRMLGPRRLTRVIEDSSALPIVMALTVVAAVACQLLVFDRGFCGDRTVSVALLAFNLLVHEAGHALVLELFLPGTRITWGFRFIFVFPAVYVNTTASYLLPRGKRAAVHLAGVFANAVCLIVGDLFFPGATSANTAVAWMVALNLVPVMKGDGYQVLAALLGWRTPELGSGRRMVEECARGVATVALIALLTFATRTFLLFR